MRDDTTPTAFLTPRRLRLPPTQRTPSPKTDAAPRSVEVALQEDRERGRELARARSARPCRARRPARGQERAAGRRPELSHPRPRAPRLTHGHRVVTCGSMPSARQNGVPAETLPHGHVRGRRHRVAAGLEEPIVTVPRGRRRVRVEAEVVERAPAQRVRARVLRVGLARPAQARRADGRALPVGAARVDVARSSPLW